jgi:hypothetical protein
MMRQIPGSAASRWPGRHKLPGKVAVKSELDEKTCKPSLATSSLHCKMGWPILMPKALASLDREMMHPSLLESTTTGLCSREGLKTRSHEA